MSIHIWKFFAKNSSLKRPGILLSKAERLLQQSSGKNCCWSLLQNYHCNRFASSSISCRDCIAEAKKPAFLKKQILQKQAFFVVNSHFWKKTYYKNKHFLSKILIQNWTLNKSWFRKDIFKTKLNYIIKVSIQKHKWNSAFSECKNRILQTNQSISHLRK